jgi:hypothetical protein
MVPFMAPLKALSEQPAAKAAPVIWRWIKTDCGRAKYADLDGRPGPLARLRLTWFVLVAAIRDWCLPPPQEG